jgi:cytochrome bd-type quinol oxidase subunit 2
MQLPSVDVFIGLFFLVGIAYGFILQREKTITTLCSVYIGIVIASSFSQTIFDFFNGNTVIANQIWIKGNASTSTIAIVLFFASILFVSGAINSQNKKSDGISVIEVVVYSALMIALILSTVLSFLPEQSRNHYIEISTAAKYIYSYRTLFVVAPPIMLVVLNWKKKK